MLSETHTDQTLTGSAVVNKTGIDGFLPENLLVYIATHHQYRGKGIGKQLMQHVLSQCEGDCALHVAASNPAKKRYESLGFTNKYLEMRLKKDK